VRHGLAVLCEGPLAAGAAGDVPEEELLVLGLERSQGVSGGKHVVRRVLVPVVRHPAVAARVLTPLFRTS
jgi:hypothetical protein